MEEQKTPIYSGKIAIICIGIPGMGKSSLIPALTEIFGNHGFTINVVSSDKVRRKCMNEYMQKNGCDEDRAFEKTQKSGKSRFEQKVTKNLNKAIPNHVVLLDKNHPPNAWGGALKLIQSCNTQVRIVALTPESTPYTFGKYTYPISLALLVQCCLRVNSRGEHETLNGGWAKQVGVVLMMYGMYRGIQFDTGMSRAIEFVMCVPFGNEGTFEISSSVEQKIQKILTSGKPGGMTPAKLCAGLCEALAHVDTSQFGFVDATQTLAAQINMVLTATEAQARPERQKAQEAQPTKKQKKNSAPLYVGVDVNDSLGYQLLKVIHAALTDLQALYPNKNSLSEDVSAFSSMLETPFVSGQSLTDIWRFTNSLHMTTLFIGGNRKLLNSLSDYCMEGAEFTLEITRILYSPENIITAAVQFVGPSLQVNNAVPHITLLLGRYAAKFSNDFLQMADLRSPHALIQTEFKHRTADVFTIELNPPVALTGRSKAYFN